MFNAVSHLFRKRRDSLPDATTQANIGKLAVHHLDKALTRIELLAGLGKKGSAGAELDLLLQFFKNQNKTVASSNFESAPTSNETALAIGYLTKLFDLTNALVDAGRLEEAAALKPYFDACTRRIEDLYPKLSQIRKRKRLHF